MRELLLFVLVILTASTFVKGQVVINEICPANADLQYDPQFYNFSPWVELYNKNASSVSIGGFYLSDDATVRNKWRIPNGTSIPGNGRLIIWCDKQNSGNHTNFSLDSDGEDLVLSNASLTELDKITFPKQYTNVAYGRKTDGASEWAYLTRPTPGTANNNSTASARLESPDFSLPAGRYSSTQSLTMSHITEGTEIRYTTDGSEPTPSSSAYSQPITISATTIVKAIAFKNGFIPSKAEVRTFFINEHTFTLPVVSISTKPTYLWDNTIGIYVEGTNGTPGNCNGNPVNYNQDWDRHAVYEHFYPNGVKDFDQGVDIRIGGACSRNNPQKSLVIKAHDKYGKNHIDKRMFSDKKTDRFGGFMLRNSGNDFWNTMFRDALMQSLTIGQMDIDYMAYQPAIFYLNGSYWGIQNLREKIDGDYIESNYGISKDDVDLIETAGNAIEGTNEAYFTYLDSLQKIDLSSVEAFSFIDRHIDVQEFINYLTAEIYYCNTDWPGNNVKFWRQRSGNGKFRWILWDLDFGFELYSGMSWATHPTLYFATEPNNTDWPNPAWSTLHLRLLLQNPVFRSRFIQTFTSSLNTTFNPDRVIGMIDSFQQRIAAEIPYHTARWGMSVDNWNNEVQRLRNFAVQRNSYMHEHLKEFFGLYDQVNISIIPDGHGSILLNGITSTTPASNIRYFRNMPFTAKAVASNGYRFKNWKITKKESATIPLVVTDSQWKYYDQGNQPSAAWHSLAFDDSTWPQGTGQFGYGDGDEQTVINYGSDASNKYITTYFRNSFEVSDTTSLQTIEASVLYDDGVVVYLNGTEVYRDNLPGGAIDYSTLALGAIPTENAFIPFTIPKGIIRPGQNIIAVEVHQNSVQSSDISFQFTMQTSRLGSETETTSTAIVLSDTAKSDVVLEAFFEPAAAYEGLVINEISASESSLTDENGDQDDWIELYNAGTQPVNLSGLFLTDDSSNKMKHLVGSGKNGETIIAPGGYKLLWADEDLYQGALHVNFKLSNEGETIGLYQLTGNSLTKLDEVSYPESKGTVSFSRIPNATGPFTLTAALTPLQENTFVTSIEENEIDETKLYPNPSANHITIESAYNIRSLAVHDSQGAVVSYRSYDTSSVRLDVKSWAPGLYAIILQTDRKLIVKRFVKE